MVETGREKEERTLSIGHVSKETDLPVSTVRYYEKEFGSYLQLAKTPGGHRRFNQQDVEKLKRIHLLVHGQGLSLKDAKAKLVSDRDPVLMRRDLDLLLEVFESLIHEHAKMRKAIGDLATRIVALEDQGKKKKFKLF